MSVAIFAVHRLANGQWEIIAPDDDPCRPPWRRIVVLGLITTAEPVCEFSARRSLLTAADTENHGRTPRRRRL
jgi:hypothetical protein